MDRPELKALTLPELSTCTCPIKPGTARRLGIDYPWPTVPTPRKPSAPLFTGYDLIQAGRRLGEALEKLRDLRISLPPLPSRHVPQDPDDTTN